MRIGVALSDLREEVLIEAGISSDAGFGVEHHRTVDQKLRRMERLLATKYDFPAMNVEETVTVDADARYADMPANLTFSDIRLVSVAYGSEWLPITHGIGPRERTIYNTSQRALPIQRWEVQAPGNVNFEVWPIGEVEQTLRFEGQKSPGTMTKDTDVCVIDADALVMYAAAEFLARDSKADAELMISNAVAHINEILKAGTIQSGAVTQTMPGGRVWRPGIDYIPPGST